MTPIPPIVQVGDIRRFSDNALQDEVDKVLASLPEDHIAVALRVGGDAQGIVLAGAVRLGAGWSLMGQLEHRTAGTWDWKVGLQWSGK